MVRPEKSSYSQLFFFSLFSGNIFFCFNGSVFYLEHSFQTPVPFCRYRHAGHGKWLSATNWTRNVWGVAITLQPFKSHCWKGTWSYEKPSIARPISCVSYICVHDSRIGELVYLFAFWVLRMCAIYALTDNNLTEVTVDNVFRVLVESAVTLFQDVDVMYRAIQYIV